jgi:hypothetical protein
MWARVSSAVALGLLVSWWIWLQRYDGFEHWIDASAFWGIQLDDSLYATPLGDPGAFVYSPVVAQLLAPVGSVPFPVFYALLSAANLTVMILMAGPRLALLLLVFFPPIASEVGTGNIHLLIGGAIVLAFRHPGWWALPLLTKVTPGIGVVWHAFRGEWRVLATVCLITILLVVPSAAIAGDLWFAWFERLAASDTSDTRGLFDTVPLWMRVSIAVGIVWLAARLDRPALVICATIVALPVIWVNALAMLVAVLPFYRGTRSSRSCA